MRNPLVVLDGLANKAKEPNYKFQRLYRNLYNREFFLMAYNNMYAKPGNMTEGADGKTIDGMSLKRIDEIIESLKDESYQPNPARRTYIPKKNGDKRPLGIPSFDDKLVQTVVKYILESIYEGKFSKNSHGFRPNRSCHTALIQIKNTFNRTKWFVEGDIKGFFDNIDHNILINILRKHIDDEKFIRLIWKFLRAGYIEEWSFNSTYSGTPQGGIISPILANIYLNELDKFVEEFKTKFDKGAKRKPNKAWTIQNGRLMYYKKKLRDKWDILTEDEKRDTKNMIKEKTLERRKHKALEPMDENYRRIHYVRYADDFLISVIGSKEDAIEVKEQLTKFLSEKLKLELSQEKTLITHNSGMARFLGYNITIWQKPYIRKGSDGRVAMTYGHIMLYLPKEVWVKKLTDYKAVKTDSLNSNNWKDRARVYLMNLDDLEIISTYNAEIGGLYNYYKLASNVSVLSNFWWIMQGSLLKTFAAKYKSTKQKMRKKFDIDGTIGVRYKTKKGEKVRYFYERSFTKAETAPKSKYDLDLLPKTVQYGNRTSLVERLKAGKCEYCGATNVPLEIHHVRKMNDLKGKTKWEQNMIARQRKTIALCAQGHGNSCHSKLHSGKLD